MTPPQLIVPLVDVESLFQRAADLPDAERDAFVLRECGADTALRAEVSSLLAHYREAEGRFMSAAAPGLDRAAADELPQRVGHYEILGLIGEGGMGVVYEARQESPRRVVALKLMRAGMASRDTLRRFQFEGEILGQLQHPGIAQIFEAGMAPVQTPCGISPPAPFFAMELVRGDSLLRHAESRRLTVRERLDLIARVCDAVEHAHQRGVIHRDLKPANILVDAAGQPKVLDFGVARLMNVNAPAASLLTSAGALIGTLQYMSPEQIGGRPQDVDTRADVFSLGVIMFELLTGALPFPATDGSLTEAIRSIKDDEPRRAGTLRAGLRGEVEAICATALRKDRLRRYQSASRLAEDIRRYLSGRPIEARRDSALYVLRKNFWRFRWVIGAAAALMLVVTIFGIKATIQAEQNRQLASELRQSLSESNIERGRMYAQSNLGAAEALLWPEFLRHPDSRQAHWALWNLYAVNPAPANFSGHDVVVNAAAYSPNGEVLVSGSRDGSVKVWNATTYEAIATLTTGDKSIDAIAFRPASCDQSLVAVADAGGAVQLWHADSWQSAGRLEAGSAGVHGLAFSRDGRRLFTGCGDGCLREWDTTQMQLTRSINAHRAGITRMVISADGGILATGATGRVRIWNTQTMARIATLRHPESIFGLALSPDGRTLASGGKDKSIRLWDLETHACTDSIRAANGTIRFLQFDSDGEHLIVGGWYRVDKWNLRERQRSVLIQTGITTLGASEPSPGGDLVVGNPYGGQLRIAHIGSRTGRKLLGERNNFGAVALSGDGQHVACPDTQGKLSIYQLSTGERTNAPPGSNVRSSAFHPNGALVAILETGGRMMLWDWIHDSVLRTAEGYNGVSRHAIAFHPNGELMAVIRAEGQVEVSRVQTGEVIGMLPPTSAETLAVHFSRDGGNLGVVSRHRMVRLWNMASQNAVTLNLKHNPWMLDFSPDGRELAIGCWHGYIELWSIAEGRRTATLATPGGIFWSVAYRPGDPGLLASGSADGKVRLHDTASQRELLALDAFDGHDVISIGFTPDGGKLLACAADGSLCVWDLNFCDRHIAGSLEHQLRRHADCVPDPAVAERLRAWARNVLSRD